ncbi:MAG: LolA family protein [Anaplasma sp.]
MRRLRHILGVALLFLSLGWVAVPARLHAAVIGAEGLDEVLRCVIRSFRADFVQINADGSTQNGRALMLLLSGLLRFDYYPPTSASVVVATGTISYYHQSHYYSSSMQHPVIALLSGTAAIGDGLESYVVSVEAGTRDRVVHVTEESSGALVGTVSFHFPSCGSAYISELSIVESPHNAPEDITKIVFHNVKSDAHLDEGDFHAERS